MATKMTCQHCGSTNVKRDAWAVWNPELDMWEIDELFDHAYCEDCDGQTAIVEEGA